MLFPGSLSLSKGPDPLKNRN
ncbi:hypothetical protein AERO9AM_70541 [Aeromicrobium sp. 9AM]|nr:hypothetical protein AERO9AM_70541 [Aeromicrobium sp. 9AM]